MCILHWTKNWLDVLLMHEGLAIVVQMFVEVPLNESLKAWFCAILSS